MSGCALRRKRDIESGTDGKPVRSLDADSSPGELPLPYFVGAMAVAAMGSPRQGELLRAFVGVEADMRVGHGLEPGHAAAGQKLLVCARKTVGWSVSGAMTRAYGTAPAGGNPYDLRTRAR
jgi:hypothetical protein